MADEVTEVATPEVKTIKAFDLNQMMQVEIPVKAETPKEEEKSEEKPTEEVKTEEKKEVEQPTEEEKKSTEVVDPIKKEESSQDDAITADDYVKESFGEKFGLNTETELTGVLEDYGKLRDENDDLKAKLEVAEKAEPKFKHESHKVIAKFLEDLPDPTLAADRTETFLKLQKINTKSDDGKVLLQEAFVLEHPDIPRDRAITFFNRDFNQKYNKKKDDFTGTEQEWKEELEITQTSQDMAVSKAKRFIETKQAEFKLEKPSTEDKAPKENLEVKAGIEKMQTSLDTYLKEFKGLTLTPTKNKEDNFNVVLSKEEHATVVKAAKTWVSNPGSYKVDGKFADSSEPAEIYQKAAFALLGPKIIEKMHQHMKSQIGIIRAEDIAKTEPERKTKVGSDGVMKGLSEEKQWEHNIAMKKSKKSSQSMVYKE